MVKPQKKNMFTTIWDIEEDEMMNWYSCWWDSIREEKVASASWRDTSMWRKLGRSNSPITRWEGIIGDFHVGNKGKWASDGGSLGIRKGWLVRWG